MNAIERGQQKDAGRGPGRADRDRPADRDPGRAAQATRLTADDGRSRALVGLSVSSGRRGLALCAASAASRRGRGRLHLDARRLDARDQLAARPSAWSRLAARSGRSHGAWPRSRAATVTSTSMTEGRSAGSARTWIAVTQVEQRAAQPRSTACDSPTSMMGTSTVDLLGHRSRRRSRRGCGRRSTGCSWMCWRSTGLRLLVAHREVEQGVAADVRRRRTSNSWASSWMASRGVAVAVHDGRQHALAAQRWRPSCR